MEQKKDSAPAPGAPSAMALPPTRKGNKRRRTRSHNSSPSPGRGFFVPGFGIDNQVSAQLSQVCENSLFNFFSS